jgi:hypothetical protein
MNNHYFLPRLHVLLTLLAFTVSSSIQNPWLEHSGLVFELAATGDASAFQRAASVELSFRLSLRSPDFQAEVLQ